MLTPTERLKCIELYENNDLNCRELSEYFGGKISKGGVWALLKRNNIKTRNQTESVKINRYKCNDHFFDIINTEETAYFFGLLYADGCNHYKNKTITIQLSIVDLHILEQFTSILQPDRPLGFHTTKLGSKTCIMRIYSPRMSEVLNSYGMVPRKTWIKTFPEIILNSTEEIQRHFIRGYFDGNGSIYKNSVFEIASTKAMLEGILSVLTLHCTIEKYKILKKNPNLNNTTSYSLITYRKNDVLRICNWLYKDSTIYLIRKYEKYTQLTPRKT